MFTGIVEETGIIKEVVSAGSKGEIALYAKTVLEDTKVGDSISVNGVCLTVIRMDSSGFVADVMPETLRRSNLGSLRRGDKVNLERAMTANGRFGGHIVSGHIDGTGIITEYRKENNATWVCISAPKEILDLIVEKGSVAIDGISLTVAAISDTDFQVSIIPHTGEETTLLTKKAGDIVNLENDIIGKYVKKLMSVDDEPGRDEGSNITWEFLAENGF